MLLNERQLSVQEKELSEYSESNYDTRMIYSPLSVDPGFRRNNLFDFDCGVD